ncbi:MAG: TIGR00296 family protein [Nitrososphaerales archaeon]
MEEQSASLFRVSDGNLLIGSVRETITKYLETISIITPPIILADRRFEEKLGCFVTLKVDDEEKTLRGCIGFSEPIYKLSRALPESAVSAATQDPRFQPLQKASELDSLLTEVSILTKPTQVTVQSPKEIPKQIKIGKDGLIMKWSFGAGLLLPQVATEFKWGPEEFLTNLSMKAGAPPDQWLVPGTIIYKFQAQVFEETSPKGRVILAED